MSYMVQNVPRKKALIIAVSEYDDDSLHDLPFCKTDGNDMAALLGELDYEVTNQDLVGRVDGRHMQDCVYDFFNNDDIQSNDTILFYFSGHGIVGFDDTFMSSSNIEPKIPNKRGFSFNDLRSVMEGCRSKRVIVILDCCYAGSAKISKGEEMSLVSAARNHQSKFKQGEGRCLLSASLGFQESFATEMGDHSFFTHYLMNGLKGADGKSVDKDGLVTPASLMDYIDLEIDNLPADKRPQQTPLRKIETTGKFILAAHPELVSDRVVYRTSEKPKSLVDLQKFIAEFEKCAATDNFREALKLCDEALTLDPDNSTVLSYEGWRQYIFAGKYDEAISYFGRALQLEPNNAIALAHKGRVLVSENKLDESIPYLEKALQLEPNDLVVLEKLCYVLTTLGKYDEAVSCCDNLLKIKPNDSTVLKIKQSVLEHQ